LFWDSVKQSSCLPVKGLTFIYRLVGSSLHRKLDDMGVQAKESAFGFVKIEELKLSDTFIFVIR